MLGGQRIQNFAVWLDPDPYQMLTCWIRPDPDPNLFEEKRARLLPTTGEKLLFLHHIWKELE